MRRLMTSGAKSTILFFCFAAISTFLARAHPPVAMEDKGPSPLAPQELRVEGLRNPVGIDCQKPRFSWTFTSDKDGNRSLMQSGYRILVASTPELLNQNKGDTWDSGNVRSSEYSLIEYTGKPLRSHTNYYWKLRTWDQDGKASAGEGEGRHDESPVLARELETSGIGKDIR